MTDNTRKLIEYRLKQAEETLAVARELLVNEHYRDSINRAYYAMFYCSLGLLATRNLGSSKHSGVLSLFSRHFVKTNKISMKAGRHLHQAFELRQRCDYREFAVITKEQAEEVVTNAASFLEEAQKVLKKID